MFALRINARDERGRGLSASYFDPNAARLLGGSGYPDEGERARHTRSPALARETEGVARPQGLARRADVKRLGATITVPADTRSEKDDMNAAMIRHFDPVAMTLPEIEAMQAQLVLAAARKRAEEDGPPEHDAGPSFIENRDGDFKAVGALEDIYPLANVEDEPEEWKPEEDHWRNLE